MKLYSTLILIFIFKLSGAQNYIPLPFGEARWMETEYSMIGPGMDFSYGYFSMDTTTYTYFGHPYHQIEMIKDSVYNLANKQSSQYIFDDTANRKVYLKSGTERLLYDFSKNIGDTIFNVYCSSSFDTALRIDSIASVNFHGINRRVFFLSNILMMPPNPPTVWIEGLGSHAGLFRNIFHCTPSDPYWSLDCIFKSGIQLYGNTCNFKVVGLDEYDISKIISIVPNPIMNNKIEIYNMYRIPLTWTLFSLDGHIIQRGSDLSIPLYNYSSGLYFLRVETDYGNGTYKIIK